MKRSAPMSRGSGFKPKAPPPRPVRQCEYRPRPREVAFARVEPERMCAPIPKFTYVRDERYRDACRALACQHCDAEGTAAGVTWAHSNQGQHGHAKGIKASDQFVAALCWVCHRELDQGKEWSQAEKVRMWDAAHARTVRLATALGLWPKGLPMFEPERDALTT